MSKKNLVICDCEFPYVHYLMENILEKKAPSLHVFVCTTWEKVMELMDTRVVHILLLDESFLYVPATELDNMEQVFVLTHRKEAEEIQGRRAVYKYQHVDRILAEVFENSGISFQTRTSGTRVFAVYSPIGRCGKTSFAIALGKELARGGKTLYLHLDSYSGQEMLEREEENLNLGDLLYFLKQEHTNPASRLAAMTLQDERLDFLLPIPISTDLKEVVKEDWLLLLEWLEKESPYENILLDIGEGVQGIFDILNRCDKIYMPMVPDEVSERKLCCYERNLQAMNLGNLEKKTFRIVIPEKMDVNISTILTGERL